MQRGFGTHGFDTAMMKEEGSGKRWAFEGSVEGSGAGSEKNEGGGGKEEEE